MASSDLDDLFGEDTTFEENPPTQPDRATDEASDAGSAADDLEIQKLLQADPATTGGEINFGHEGPIDQSGKADDAVDYEDVSDDDLPDEEPATASSGDGPGLTDDGGTPDATDDLFGDDDENQSAYDFVDLPTKALQNGDGSESFDTVDTADTPSSPTSYDVNFDPPPKPASIEEVKAACPGFERGVVPFLNEWFRSKPAHYRSRTEPKPPKPLTHPKISLDIAPDQERIFRSAGTDFTSNRAQRLEEAAARGIILDLEPLEEEEEIDHFDYTPLEEDDVIDPAGHTVADLRLALTDFEVYRNYGKSSAPETEPTEDDEWMAEYGGRPKKKSKLSDFPLIDQPVFPVPSFHNFQELTAQIGSRVVLDLNDPAILIAPVDEQKPSKKRLLNGKLKYGANAKNPLSRFNVSNDHAYEALRANNQSKVRASIGNISVEHSMPALRCAWPYYKVKRDISELRASHRMPLHFKKFVNKPISFTKSTVRKKKHMKGLSTQEIYAKTSDLSLSDNSTAMLLEYSEEMPAVLSNFGMGNRIINYYRKANDEDTFRPKEEVGETQVLQPTDESPFNKFGKVEPGETVPTLHNSMYRAPVFKHEVKPNDFLVVRSTTGTEGTNWHLRNIDHLYVVGQELPSLEVPAPGSRKDTTIKKNRMAMVSFRTVKHSKDSEMRISDLTKHIEFSTDSQNRQKLKEILKYNKDLKIWKLKDNHMQHHSFPPIPLEESAIRAMITPDDVCLIDAMHVGERQLEDAGYFYADYNGDNNKDTGPLEVKLAPWKTTENFLEASANKAMLELKGPGDPSGCGMAFSMIKTSMKGGFIKNLQGGPMGTSADAMERQRKANGGHDYNVHEQEAKYAEVLDEIWRTQKALLSDAIEHTEMDEEDLHQQDEQRAAQASANASVPANFDDSASMMSDARSTKCLRITRQVRNSSDEIVTETQIIRNPRVARAYAKARADQNSEHIDIYDAEFTGDPDIDKAKRLKAQQELQRLQRNKERREHRERMKAKKNAGDRDNNSPTPATPGLSDFAGTPVYQNGKSGDVKEKGKKAKTIPGTTARKCANCGASGHIRTNRKLCPMLNGEWPNGVQPADWGKRGNGGDYNTANGAGGANGVDAGGVNGMNGSPAPASALDGFEHQNGNGYGNGDAYGGVSMDLGEGMDFGMGVGGSEGVDDFAF